MSLGFDIGRPVIDPTNPKRSVEAWKKFFTKWDRQPEFVGRYFGNTIRRGWVLNEIPSNLTTLVPHSFDKLAFVCVFTGTGRYAKDRKVNIKGEVCPPPEGKFPLCFELQGEDKYGNSLPPVVDKKGKTISGAENRGRIHATNTLDAIEALLLNVDPASPTIDLKLSKSGYVFVFLDVEPQTRLHPDFWRGWSQTISAKKINLSIGTSLAPDIVQPFLPCLYCAFRGTIYTEHGALIHAGGLLSDSLKAVFSDPNASQCWAIATGWEQRFTSEEALAASEEDVLEKMQCFGALRQNAAYPDAPLVLWQYRINLNEDGFEIDLDVTSASPFHGRPITDFMLRIV